MTHTCPCDGDVMWCTFARDSDPTGRDVAGPNWLAGGGEEEARQRGSVMTVWLMCVRVSTLECMRAPHGQTAATTDAYSYS